eukprot:CAMPEP_0117578846 /NCGR_PEP_ID=MMETSP0784-20121206/64272_1 /TAXON_ID=39447 /ORGANISM="" /LENGTH=342 /DNA_ID=CAMNT_0005378639 /DNA_START=169 /DNA_END=1197 /DNA_ORIENTATION=+
MWPEESPQSAVAVWHHCGVMHRRREVPRSSPDTVDGLPVRVHLGLAEAMSYERRISLRINELLPTLREALSAECSRCQKLDSCQILSTSDGEALVALWYSCHLDDSWKATFADHLASRLRCSVVGHGRDRKKRWCSGVGKLLQSFEVGGKQFPQFRRDGIFSQSNLGTCRQMMQWAQEVTSLPPATSPTGDLLELYCGNGNFTLPLAANFRRVLAAEKNSLAIAMAKEARQLSRIDNVAFVSASAEDIVNLLSKRSASGLPEHEFHTCFVDPPRTGLGKHARQVALQMKRLIYVSCSPKALVADLRWIENQWSKGLRVTAAAFFDQFPYSHHAEVGLVLEQR